MAATRCIILFVLAIWKFDFGYSASSHNAPAPAADCSSLILNMADCLSFVTNGSTVTKPEGTCCSGLKSVLKANPACLCEGFRNSAQLGVVLNVTKAVTLPSACEVSAPSVTTCGLSLSPAAGPPAVSPSSSPERGGVATAPASESGVTTEKAPTPSPGNSASSKALSLAALLASLSVYVFLSLASF